LRPSSICADCSAADPTWASINRGVLICDECCSVHRSLGRHVSQVRSIRRGQWSPTQHAMLYQLANHGANNIWEHQLKDPSQNKHGRKKPASKDPLHPNKADFIRAKYQFLSFVNKQKESDVNSIDDVSKELHSSVRTNNVETCLRLLSKGADPNYFHKEKGNCPLHVAAQAGQVAQVELLVVYGADPGALDVNNKSPIDYARIGGFSDIADRLIECQYELTDRLAFHVCGRKPDHRNGQNFIIPEIGDNSTSDLSELDKQAKKKLQALTNHLFEELAMDVYDEVDRRENDKIWLETQDHSAVSDRTTVPFLPVNPDLSTTRNQGRQKLARFNKREFTTLIIDILNDARRRQTGFTSPVNTPKEHSKLFLLTSDRLHSLGAFSDEEPLYDSVASDEDYSSIDTHSVQSMRSMNSEAIEGPVSTDEYMEVKKALAGAETTIKTLVHKKTDLEQKVHIMQSTDGNVPNGFTADENDEISQGGIPSVMMDSVSSTHSMPGGAVGVPVDLPEPEEVVKKTEKITKRIQDLLKRAQEGDIKSYNPCSDRIFMAVTEMEALFPRNIPKEEVFHSLQLLKDSANRLRIECQHLASDSKQSTTQVIQCAYDVAKAAKQLVTL
ncbi:hypothetical protein LOTGIDRAFT_51898, partial [Lottia gigantea]